MWVLILATGIHVVSILEVILAIASLLYSLLGPRDCLEVNSNNVINNHNLLLVYVERLKGCYEVGVEKGSCDIPINLSLARGLTAYRELIAVNSTYKKLLTLYLSMLPQYQS